MIDIRNNRAKFGKVLYKTYIGGTLHHDESSLRTTQVDGCAGWHTKPNEIARGPAPSRCILGHATFVEPHGGVTPPTLALRRHSSPPPSSRPRLLAPGGSWARGQVRAMFSGRTRGDAGDVVMAAIQIAKDEARRLSAQGGAHEAEEEDDDDLADFGAADFLPGGWPCGETEGSGSINGDWGGSGFGGSSARSSADVYEF